MWRIQKLFNSDMGDTGRGVGFSYEEVFEMCQAADTHIAENIVMILSKDVTFFCLNKRNSFFLRDAIAPLLFLFMSKSVQKNAKHVEQAPLFS